MLHDRLKRVKVNICDVHEYQPQQYRRHLYGSRRRARQSCRSNWSVGSDCKGRHVGIRSRAARRGFPIAVHVQQIGLDISGHGGSGGMIRLCRDCRDAGIGVAIQVIYSGCFIR